jgi:endonuclease YncB( thermonuclease family)
MKFTPFILAGLAFLFAPGTASAHDTALDRNGCHENRPWGGYHCHRGPLAGQFFRSRKDAEWSMPRRARGKRARPPRDPDYIFGRAEVIDGNTIRVGDQRIRLFGIDAFHDRQRCRNANGNRYRCGRQAIRALARRIDDQRIACRRKQQRRHQTVAVCWLGAEDIGAWMVLSGWAMADRQHGSDYIIHERRARRRRAGAWQGEFRHPRKWRERRRNRRK